MLYTAVPIGSAMRTQKGGQREQCDERHDAAIQGKSVASVKREGAVANWRNSA